MKTTIMGSNELKVEKQQDGRYWFSMVNNHGGSVKPYGTVTREELESLKKLLETIFQEN